jgi:hypothetical protein
VWVAVSRARRVWAMQSGVSAGSGKACANQSCGTCATTPQGACALVSVGMPVQQHLQ